MSDDLSRMYVTCWCGHEADIDAFAFMDDETAFTNPVFRCPACGVAWRRSVKNSTWKRYVANGRERYLPDHVELEEVR